VFFCFLSFDTFLLYISSHGAVDTTPVLYQSVTTLAFSVRVARQTTSRFP
jgi:hypothetical protein